MEIVEAKAEDMRKQVVDFISSFGKLNEMGLPSFGDDDLELLSKNAYKKRISVIRMDHSKFKHMEQLLIGKMLMEKIQDDFEILNKLISIGERLSPASYSNHTEIG